jgi:hypothetical protein
MKIDWNDIILHLRQELVDYGALLGLYEEQQKALFARQPDTVLGLSGKIKDQVARVVVAREAREGVAARFAVAHQLAPNATIRELLTAIDKDAHPLFEALLSELNLLLHRVRRTHRQNHTLLSHTVTMHRETLQLLRPNSFTRTYSPKGKVSISAGRVASTLCAAG